MTSRVALVVDDDPDIQGVVDFILQQAGFEVHLEADGEAALAVAVAVRPDVMLLDWMMPRMSGVEVCRLLRSNPECHSVAVIMLTARAQEADVQLGFEAGADDYIVKPFSPRRLVSRVEAVVARPRPL